VGGRDLRHVDDGRGGGSVGVRRGRRAALTGLLVVVLLAGLVLAAWRAGLVQESTAPDPLTEPEAVDPPPGLALPAPEPPDLVATPVDPTRAGRADPAAVRRALRTALADPDLGPHVVAGVGDLQDAAPEVLRGRGPVTPASTTKLLTATAALAALGPDRTFETTTVLGPGALVSLVGGGDPLLARRPATRRTAEDATYPVPADLLTLARATAARLREADTTTVRVAVDDTLFTGPTASPRWRPDYVPDGVVAPITALWVDQGRDPDGFGRVADPALAAGRVFAAQLRRAGVRVVGEPVRRPASPEAVELAAVSSPPVEDIVVHLLEVSDNEAAEALAHHVGREVGGSASFAGAVRGVRRVLAGLGVALGDDRVWDGSGLSRANRVSAGTILGVLRLAASPERPDLRPVLVGLPVAGFSGSLVDRFTTGAPAGLGAVRAKTGTLTGVHALAGLATTADGVTVAFVVAADRVPEGKDLQARTALDRAAAALAACRCGVRSGVA
jgi:D-alanyl-D-alanine carboxypeptidase/D-alanyl-D-alanine-endopeptidase (penicillin-binding protein 4)